MTRIGSGDAAAKAAAEAARQRQQEAARKAAEQKRAAQSQEAQKKQPAAAIKAKRDGFVDGSSQATTQKTLSGGLRKANPSLKRKIPNKLNPPSHGFTNTQTAAQHTTGSARTVARRPFGKLSPPTQRSLTQEGPLAAQAKPANEGIFGTVASVAQQISGSTFDVAKDATKNIAQAAGASTLGQTATDTLNKLDPNPRQTDPGAGVLENQRNTSLPGGVRGLEEAATNVAQTATDAVRGVGEGARHIGDLLGGVADGIGSGAGQLGQDGTLAPAEGGLRPTSAELLPGNGPFGPGEGPGSNSLGIPQPGQVSGPQGPPDAPINADQTSTLENVQAQIDQLDLGEAEANAIFQSAQNAVTSDDPGERLEAGLDTINQLREALPADKLDQLPGIAENISTGLPAAAEFVGLANTLSDPNASGPDKATAALDFANEAGNLLTNDAAREKLTTTLDRFGAGVEAVELVTTITDPDASNLDKAKATFDFASTAGDLLPPGKQQKLLNAVGGLGAPVSTIENALKLTDPDLSALQRAEAGIALVGGLGDTIDSFKDLGKALDGLGVSKALGLGPGSTFRGVFDATLKGIGDVASKLNLRFGTEALQSVGKAFGKAIPALGAAVSAFDTVRMGAIADNDSLPGEIRYIAGLGAGVNGVDTALGITEALGIGNVAFAANVGLAVTGFAADVATSQMIQDHENGNFNPSDGLRAFIGATAVAGAVPTGGATLGLLTTSFGAGGAIGVLKDTVKVGGQFVGQAAEAIFDLVKDQGEEAIREVGEFVADLPGEVQEQISGAIAGAADILGDGAQFFVNGLGDTAGVVLDGIDGFGDFLGDVGGFITDRLPWP